jgi:hypothetical protein
MKGKAITTFGNITKMGKGVFPDISSNCNDVSHMLIACAYIAYYFSAVSGFNYVTDSNSSALV